MIWSNFTLPNNSFNRRAVRQVALDKREGPIQRLDFLKIARFDGGRIEIVEIIERPDGVALAQKPLAYVRANKTRAACHQEIHRRTLAKGVQSPKVQESKVRSPKSSPGRKPGPKSSVVPAPPTLDFRFEAGLLTSRPCLSHLCCKSICPASKN